MLAISTLCDIIVPDKIVVDVAFDFSISEIESTPYVLLNY